MKKEIDKEKERIRAREYRINNPDKVKEAQKKYVLKNKEKIYAKVKEYREINKEIIKQNNNKSATLRKINNPLFKLKCSLRSNLCKFIKRNGYSKKSRTVEVLGCSFEEFKTYLESRFEVWMTWENRGLYNGTECYGWDIDHIIPISTATTEEELLKLNHFSNLQPLCSYVNRDIKKNFEENKQ